MDIKTQWIYDDFFPAAAVMRQKIDEHFTEEIARNHPFTTRCIWNYWYIPGLYTYFRTEPRTIFPDEIRHFMAYLRDFAARTYGLAVPQAPVLSMYINGCGQNIHNDAKNGRLAYVFSLTNWEGRHFHGGETLVYKTGDSFYQRSFEPSSGHHFYESVPPLFNRLSVFDDRMPHAVRTIQGGMDPHDARFVIHGHMEEPKNVAFADGGLHGVDLTEALEKIRVPISAMLQANGCHGFLTFEVSVGPSGIVKETIIKHPQLLPLSKASGQTSECMEQALSLMSKHVWPLSASPSRLIFAIASEPLR